MILTADIHCHSGYSGGVGKINLDKLYNNLSLKGINLYGSADILHPQWRKQLYETLYESEDGLFILKGYKKEPKTARIILEAEIVVTAPYIYDLNKRKSVHIIILFPSFNVVEQVAKIFSEHGMKINIGRPFIKFSSINHIEDFFSKLIEKFPLLEIIPAHIFTPDGILGGENPINSINEFFGDFTKDIHVLESGLSADPDMILSIDQLSDFLVISNSDAHSEALNRIGREYFAIEVQELSYSNFIKALREKRLLYTVEFKPEHGRYFLTGHRSDRHDNQKEIYFKCNDVPADLICPLCKKRMIAGVEYRVHLLKKSQYINTIKRKQKFYYSIPLIDIISVATGSSTASKKVEIIYRGIIEKIDYESNFYMLDDERFTKIINELKLDIGLKKALVSIRENKFKFEPEGFDGNYGKLIINN